MALYSFHNSKRLKMVRLHFLQPYHLLFNYVIKFDKKMFFNFLLVQIIDESMVIDHTDGENIEDSQNGQGFIVLSFNIDT